MGYLIRKFSHDGQVDKGFMAEKTGKTTYYIMRIITKIEYPVHMICHSTESSMCNKRDNRVQFL